MEKPLKENSDRPPRSRPTSRKEKEVVEPPRSHSPKLSKTGRINEAKAQRKEKVKTGTSPVMVEQQTELKVRSTVVDIDSVREDEVKEEFMGLLEIAGQEDSKWNVLTLVSLKKKAAKQVSLLLHNIFSTVVFKNACMKALSDTLFKLE